MTTLEHALLDRIEELEFEIAVLKGEVCGLCGDVIEPKEPEEEELEVHHDQ